MSKRSSNPFRMLYWKMNRRFLEAFAEALIGQGQGDLRPDGKLIMDNLEAYLGKIPPNVFTQVSLALMILPLSYPETLPASDLGRLLIKIWVVIKSNITRYGFPNRSREERARIVDKLFQNLARQADEEADDVIKLIIILNTIKSLLSASYLELQSTWKGLGYSPYPNPPRPWYPPSGDVIVDPPRTAVAEYLHQNVKTAREVSRKVSGKTNYCVIGSGAGGAIAAHRIQELDPNARVVVLESGPLVTNEAFPVRILEATARLFMNAGATLSKDQLYQFRQGHCVGGSTTLNNSVSIKPTGFWWENNLVERWKEVGANLNWDELYQQYSEIGPLLNVHPIEDRIVTPMADTVVHGFMKIAPNLKVSHAPVNTVDCIGCGRCNLGCQYDAKQSMLVTFIPKVVENGGLLVPNAHVEEIHFDLDRRSNRQVVKSVRVKTVDGESIEIEADKFVLAAGAYASTKLLWKSGFTGFASDVRTVGKRFTGNLGSPVFGKFKEKLDGWAGQQVGYVIEMPDERIVVETAYAPPALLGLSASQWGDDFMKLVESYSNFGVAIPVFSTFGYGEISRGLLRTGGWIIDYRLGGFIIDFKMADEDWRRMSKGMKLAAQALLAMGADEIITTRFDARTLKPGDDIDEYFSNMGPADFYHIETAHLQGGNVINRDPERGVVDENFKVHGCDNLWITDASVIPSPITVNLQFTIMALARYAASRIVAAPVVP